MIFYFFIYFFSLVGHFLDVLTRLRYRKINVFLFITTVALVFVAGLRVGGGVDYFSYERIYNDLGTDWYTSEKLEAGFYFLNYIYSGLESGFYAVVFTSFLLSLIPALYIILRFSFYPSFSFFLLLSFEYFFAIQNLIRQGIAMGIFIFSLKFIIERKPVGFLLTISLASFFHKTAALFFPLYILSFIRFNRFLLAVFLFLSLALSFYDSLFVQILFYIDELFFSSRFSHLLRPESFVARDIGLRFYVFMFIYLLIILRYHERLHEKESLRVFYYIFILYLFLVSLFGGYEYTNRFMFYFYIAPAVLLPALMMFMKRVEAFFYAFFLIVICLIVSLRSFLADGHSIFPYCNAISGC